MSSPLRCIALILASTHAFRAPTPRSLAPARVHEKLHQKFNQKLKPTAPLAASPLETAVAANSALAAVGIAPRGAEIIDARVLVGRRFLDARRGAALTDSGL